MKVALVYDDLVQKGGGEKFFLNIASLYKDATIVCPIISKYYLNKLKSYNVLHSKKLSFLLIFGTLGYKVASFLSHFYFESLKLQKYNIVISLSNRLSHTVVTNNNQLHIAIINSPFRELFTPTKNTFVACIFNYMRLFNQISIKRADVVVAISHFTKLKIRRYLTHKKLIVIPPCISQKTIVKPKKADYFLMIGRVNKHKYKYFFNALRVLNSLDVKVIFVGGGSLQKKLKNKFLNNKNIVFKGFVSEKQKHKLLANCVALIHPQIEDFGLTPLEALLYNKPTIAYKRGGVKNYLNKKVALFYTSKKGLLSAINSINNYKVNKNEAKKILQVHSFKNFKYNLEQIIKKYA